MGPRFVVVDHPPVRRLADMVQTGKQMSVKHVLPEGTVEALDVGVLVRLAMLDVQDGHAAALAQAVNSSPVNPGPLSVRTNFGKPWLRLSCSKRRIRQSELVEILISMCNTSRLKSSTLKARSRRPQADVAHEADRLGTLGQQWSV